MTVKYAQSAVREKIIFNVPIKTVSPLRIASGHTDNITDILVLKNKEGKAFIPATSLAGILRNEICSLYGENVAGFIFGNAERKGNDAQSLITINDISLNTAEVITRDGVKLHMFAGTGIETAKYDFEAVEKGAEGILSMEMTVRQGHLDIVAEESTEEKKKAELLPVDKYLHTKYAETRDIFMEVAASLADLLTAGIHVGALTTKGLGLIKSQEPVKVFLFDFTDGHSGLEQEKNAAEAWLQYIISVSENSEKAILPKEEYTASEVNEAQYPPGDFAIEAAFAIKSSLLIRDMVGVQQNLAGNNVSEDTTIAAVPMKSGGDYVIPGTSVKGALRSKAYKILFSLTPKNKKEAADLFLENLMGHEEKKDEQNEVVSPAQRGRLLIDEIYIAAKGNPNLHEMKQARNRIDRFTGATIDTALFSEVAIWQTNKEIPSVQMKLRVKNAQDEEAGLMLLLLRELWVGNLPLGGGKGIGRGVLEGISATIHYQKHTIKMHQVLPAIENYGNIIIEKVIDQDKPDLNPTDDEKNLLEGYVSELNRYFAKMAGDLHE